MEYGGRRLQVDRRGWCGRAFRPTPWTILRLFSRISAHRGDVNTRASVMARRQAEERTLPPRKLEVWLLLLRVWRKHRILTRATPAGHHELAQCLFGRGELGEVLCLLAERARVHAVQAAHMLTRPSATTFTVRRASTLASWAPNAQRPRGASGREARTRAASRRRSPAGPGVSRPTHCMRGAVVCVTKFSPFCGPNRPARCPGRPGSALSLRKASLTPRCETKKAAYCACIRNTACGRVSRPANPPQRAPRSRTQRTSPRSNACPLAAAAAPLDRTSRRARDVRTTPRGRTCAALCVLRASPTPLYPLAPQATAPLRVHAAFRPPPRCGRPCAGPTRRPFRLPSSAA